MNQVSPAIQPGFVAWQNVPVVPASDQNLTVPQRRQHRVVIIVVQGTGLEEASALRVEDLELSIPAADQDISICEQNCSIGELEPLPVHSGNLAQCPCPGVVDFRAVIFAPPILLIRPAQEEHIPVLQ